MTAIRLRRILRAMRRGDRRVIQDYTAASGTAREAVSSEDLGSSSSGEDTRTLGGAAFEQAAVVDPAPETVRVARPRSTKPDTNAEAGNIGTRTGDAPRAATSAQAGEGGGVVPSSPRPRPIPAIKQVPVVEPTPEKVTVAWPLPRAAIESPASETAPVEPAPVIVEPVRIATPAPPKSRRPMIAIDLRSVPSSMEQRAARWRT